MKSIIALVLIVLVAAPPVGAAQAADADAWRTFAGQLEPNAFVRVKLKSGESFRAHVVRVTDDAIRLNPKKRIAVPLRQIGYNDITSLERQNESKWNPASKVLLGVGVGLGVLYALAIVALAGYD